jgi:lipid A disaccharide synthetase
VVAIFKNCLDDYRLDSEATKHFAELLQNDCNSQNIHKELKRFIDDKNLSLIQINDTQKALEMIGLNSNISASKKACNAIFDLLKK